MLAERLCHLNSLSSLIEQFIFTLLKKHSVLPHTIVASLCLKYSHLIKWSSNKVARSWNKGISFLREVTSKKKSKKLHNHFIQSSWDILVLWDPEGTASVIIITLQILKASSEKVSFLARLLTSTVSIGSRVQNS